MRKNCRPTGPTNLKSCRSSQYITYWKPNKFSDHQTYNLEMLSARLQSCRLWAYGQTLISNPDGYVEEVLWDVWIWRLWWIMDVLKIDLYDITLYLINSCVLSSSSYFAHSLIPLPPKFTTPVKTPGWFIVKWVSRLVPSMTLTASAPANRRHALRHTLVFSYVDIRFDIAYIFHIYLVIRGESYSPCSFPMGYF